MKNILTWKCAGSAIICLSGAGLLTACGGSGSAGSGTSEAKLLVSANSTKITITSANVTASSTDTTNVPNNANDNDLNTHWTGGAASGTQWIQFNLGGCYTVDYAKIGWYDGDTRMYNYTLKASSDNGATWTVVKTGNSDGTTAGRTVYDFPDTSANVMRLESTGNNTSTKVSVSELEFWSPSAGTCGTATTTTTTKAATTTTKAATTTTTSATTTTTTLLNKNKSPGENFNLSAYKLQTFDASLNVKEVDPIGTYTDQYFYTDATTGAMTFYVPSGAGSTANSDYPRSELRNNTNWQLGGTHTLSATVKVLEQPSTGEIIIGQIHGDVVGGSEALKVRWSNGSVVMGVKTNYGDTEQKITVVSGLSIGSTINYNIKVVGSALTLTVNGVAKTFTYGSSWTTIANPITGGTGVNLYFKLGNYSQDGTVDGSHAKVEFTAVQ